VLRIPKCRSTFYGQRIPKNTGLVPNGHSQELFLRQISAFKRRRKYHSFIQVNPVPLRGKTRATFNRISEALEKFRCTLGLEPTIFYRLASEFIIVPSGVKYYPLKEIFCEDSIAYEQFINRLVDTLPWIADIVGRDFTKERESIEKFINELSSRKISVGSPSFRSKDWCILFAIREFGPKKGWPEEELLERIRRFYKGRMKKVTVEMVLADLTSQELDGVNIKEDKRNQRVKKHKIPETYIDIIKQEDWYEDWLKQGEKIIRIVS
jgi:hypothetical protein